MELATCWPVLVSPGVFCWSVGFFFLSILGNLLWGMLFKGKGKGVTELEGLVYCIIIVFFKSSLVQTYC